MNKRPINPTEKLRAVIGEGNVDGNNAHERILKALEHYGIYKNKVILWGTGTPLREFLWSEDMADASVHVLLNVNFSDVIGIENTAAFSTGQKPMALLTETIQKVVAAQSPLWEKYATVTSMSAQAKNSPFASSPNLS